MSDNTMHKLDISLHTGPRTYDIGLFDIKDKPMKRDASSGHAMIDVCDYGDLTRIDERFRLPQSSVRGPMAHDEETGEATGVLSKGTAKRLRRGCSVVADVFSKQPQVSFGESSEIKEYVPSDLETETRRCGERVTAFHVHTKPTFNNKTEKGSIPDTVETGQFHKWAREDKQARTYRLSKPTGPRWGDVVRR